jgi:hypothetical protein
VIGALFIAKAAAQSGRGLDLRASLSYTAPSR